MNYACIIHFQCYLPQSGLLKNQIKPNKTNKNMFYLVLEDLIINQIVFYLVFERHEADRLVWLIHHVIQ